MMLPDCCKERKFIADCMLGRLAKWMRIIGCDVLYFRKIEDDQLLETAQKEGRIILTRDSLLIKRRKARGNYLFIQGDSFRDQLRQVIRHFEIDYKSSLFTRCILCNSQLLQTDKEAVKEKIPEYVYNTQEHFGICPLCQKVYWAATHKEEMVKEIESLEPL